MERGDGCSCLTNRSHFNYNPDINIKRKPRTHKGQPHAHPHTRKNKSFKITTEANSRFKETPRAVCVSVCACLCAYMCECIGGVTHLSLAESSPLANLRRSLHANTHSNSESVGCKIKTSFSFSKPRCFAYTTLSYITVIIAVIMAPNSKMHFRGRGVIEEVVAGRRRDSGGSGGKWLHCGEQAAGKLETHSTWDWTEDCVKRYQQGVIYMFECMWV